VLVPIANPASAAGLVGLAATVRTPGVGRILLLSVVSAPGTPPDDDSPVFRDAEAILGESLQRSFERSTITETLFTVAPDPWLEIARVARLHRCETVLLGAPHLEEPGVEERLKNFIATLDSDVMVVRAPHRWRISRARRVLVPMGGLRAQSRLRARLLASLTRSDDCAITFLRAVAPLTPADLLRRAERELRALARDEAEGAYEVIVEKAADPRDAILRHAADTDFVLMGMPPVRGTGRGLGDLTLAVARATDVPLVLVSGRRARPLRPGRRGPDRLPSPASERS
jgi:nucleotide-binding universal stress UspA family protein